ncbi:putative multidrug resistance protein fnx1 [Lentithecium fluviatile CBS 122367]|uniref:Putative multidrug resistance protein fnx1 n=1 Tax=Lentithecium fluviatile CBS 122367 TaxID=1168545 RepID=A0A6G1JIG0_9PLEO|nr:putative multidrug resistance protein fnx1 [Lentithecium fluviatile CBS 122367]
MPEQMEQQPVTFQTSVLDMEKSAGIVEAQSELRLQEESEAPIFLEGKKLHLLTVGLCLSIFLVNFEISIVSTSLISITDDLKQFGRSSWIITGYLLTYTAFLVILAKLSDQLGRKTILIACLAVFTIFSGACGAAQTMDQLIVFRAFQGLGGSGVYSLVFIVIFEMVPAELYPKYSVLITALFAISYVTGPLCGGAITSSTTWRWVFLLNAPAGVVALIILLLCMPNNFPNHGRRIQKKPGLRTVDAIGASLMLASITLLITGFEEASNFSPWKSAQVLALILVSIPCILAFLFYERMVTIKDKTGPEPVFPWRFCVNRVVMGLFANAFLSGAIFTSCIIQIPLRFQAVNNESPWQAGLRLIPFAVAVPVGIALVAVACGKRRLPIIYMQFAGLVLQVLGLVFMSRITLGRISWKGQYGLQFLTGIGCGNSFGVTALMTNAIVEKRDLATSTAAIVQMRMLGGALVLALVTAVMNSNLKDTLVEVLSGEQLGQVFRTTEAIAGLVEPVKTAVQETFLKGYNMQLRILLGFAAAQLPFTLLMWEREPVKIA